MTTQKRTHVSGFVKVLRINQGTATFRVAGKRFVLPIGTTFGQAIQKVKRENRNVLILFENDDHPRITGVIPSPLGAQIVAASQGWPADRVAEIKPTL